MFEEAVLTQIYWLLKNEFISLTPNDKNSSIVVKKLNSAENLPSFSKFLLDSLDDKETSFVEWVKRMSLKAGGGNPAQDIFSIAEREVEEFKTEEEVKFLIFKFKKKVWDQEKIAEMAKKELEPLKALWEEGKQQDWWELARRRLKAGLTFVHLRRWDTEED